MDDETPFPPRCGHFFHRSCIVRQIEGGRIEGCIYNCPAVLCEEPVFFVKLNRMRLDQRPVYIIRSIGPVSNEAQRDIETITDFHNSNISFGVLVPITNVEERARNLVLNAIDNIIEVDNSDRVLERWCQNLIHSINFYEFLHEFFLSRLNLLVFAYVGDFILNHFILQAEYRLICSVVVIRDIAHGLTDPDGIHFNASVVTMLYLVFLFCISYISHCVRNNEV